MESEALKAFFAHIAGFNEVPIYWPNVAVPNAPAIEHFRVTVFPVSPQNIGICGESTYPWILQIAVYVRDGVGLIRPSELVDKIRSLLPFDLRLSSVNYVFKTTDPCTVIPQIKTEGWNITPVQSRFIAIN